ncbi:phosphatase domain-containing protein [Phaeobacter inhibens]|uniref:phosphatase domain-containing protein n=1 Tax=Phaeobacter inhibens TaxID=221822 RepID=UPI004056327A
MLTALFDIDGTIAKIDHRRPLVVGEKADWKTFNSLMGDDIPNEPIVDLYRALWETKRYELILVSGRGEEFRSVTETWLTWNLIPFGKLLMRPQGDFRSDVEVKQEILDGLLSEGKTISFVVDDRDSVVAMWRRNNITCLQCAEGDF